MARPRVRWVDELDEAKDLGPGGPFHSEWHYYHWMGTEQYQLGWKLGEICPKIKEDLLYFANGVEKFAIFEPCFNEPRLWFDNQTSRSDPRKINVIEYWSNGNKKYLGQAVKHGLDMATGVTSYTRTGRAALGSRLDDRTYVGNINGDSNIEGREIVEYDNKGNIIFIGAKLDGIKSGYTEEFHIHNKNAKFRGICNSAGLKTGLGEDYHINGRLKYKGDFVDGIYSGRGAYYGTQGNLIHSGYFKNGGMSGREVVVYHEGCISEISDLTVYSKMEAYAEKYAILFKVRILLLTYIILGFIITVLWEICQ